MINNKINNITLFCIFITKFYINLRKKYKKNIKVKHIYLFLIFELIKMIIYEIYLYKSTKVSY